MDHSLQVLFDSDQLLNPSHLQLNTSFFRTQLNLSLPCYQGFLRYHHRTQYQVAIQSRPQPYLPIDLMHLTTRGSLELWPPQALNYRVSPLWAPFVNQALGLRILFPQPGLANLPRRFTARSVID